MTSTNTSIPPHKIFCFLGNHADSIHLPSYTHVLQNLFQIIQKRRVQTMRKLTKTAAVVASMAVMAMGATVMTSAAQEGWVQSGANWYYYINDNAIENQWMLSGDNWYFLGEDGKMVKDSFIQARVKLEEDDLETMDATEEEAIYYVGSDGVMIKGWKEIDSKIAGGEVTPKSSKNWYYFGGSGEMFGEQWVLAGEKWYYLGEDGKMVKNNYADDEDDECYLNGKGEWVTGWYKTTDKDLDKLEVEDEGEWVYFGNDGIVKNGWAKINSKWYYFGAVSQSATGINSSDYQMEGADTQMVSEKFIQPEKDSHYYVKSDGSMVTGWFSVKDPDDNKIKYNYYANSDGIIQKDKVQSVSSKYYYLDKDGTYDEKAYNYAYSIKVTYKNDSGSTKTKTVYFPLEKEEVGSLSEAKDKLNAIAKTDEWEKATSNLKDAKISDTVTIYKLKSNSSYSYKPDKK